MAITTGDVEGKCERLRCTRDTCNWIGLVSEALPPDQTCPKCRVPGTLEPDPVTA